MIEVRLRRWVYMGDRNVAPPGARGIPLPIVGKTVIEIPQNSPLVCSSPLPPMKPALLKTLAIVLIGALAFLLGWHLLHGGWENLKEDWTGKYKPRPHPTDGALALGPDGYYWGVTDDSSEMPGYLYKMKADGSDWKRVHTFRTEASPPVGISPMGGLVSDGVDSLLGVTSGSALEGDYGTLYKINATTGVLTTLVRFSGKSGPHLGSIPWATLAPDGRGSFWGSTVRGGTKDTGTIFKFHPASSVLTTVAECSALSDSESVLLAPYDALVSDSPAFWWGTNSEGGAEHYGTVFKVDSITGELTTVVEFTEGTGGQHPKGSLVSDGQGFLWGACAGGGYAPGTLFKVNATAGALTTILEFTGKGGSNHGMNPETALVNDGHGFLWGCTYMGGSADVGTLFKVDIASGVLTTLVEFEKKQSHHKGYRPEATLVSDGHGAFLGTTRLGGKKDAGTIFKIDIATGLLTTLVEFGKVGP